MREQDEYQMKIDKHQQQDKDGYDDYDDEVEEEDSDDVEIIRHEIIDKLQSKIGDVFLETNLRKSISNKAGSLSFSGHSGVGGGSFKASRPPLSLPEAEMPAFENPTSEFIEDFEGILVEHNVAMKDIKDIASAYDKLRMIKRQSRKKIQENDDPKMFNYFDKNFKMLVRKMKDTKG